MAYGPNEPTKESLAKENTYMRAVKDRVKSLVSSGAAANAAETMRPASVKRRIDGGEERALGPDGTYSEPGNSGSSVKR